MELAVTGDELDALDVELREVLLHAGQRNELGTAADFASERITAGPRTEQPMAQVQETLKQDDALLTSFASARYRITVLELQAAEADVALEVERKARLEAEMQVAQFRTELANSACIHLQLEHELNDQRTACKDAEKQLSALFLHVTEVKQLVSGVVNVLKADIIGFRQALEMARKEVDGWREAAERSRAETCDAVDGRFIIAAEAERVQKELSAAIFVAQAEMQRAIADRNRLQSELRGQTLALQSSQMLLTQALADASSCTEVALRETQTSAALRADLAQARLALKSSEQAVLCRPIATMVGAPRPGDGCVFVSCPSTSDETHAYLSGPTRNADAHASPLSVSHHAHAPPDVPLGAATAASSSYTAAATYAVARSRRSSTDAALAAPSRLPPPPPPAASRESLLGADTSKEIVCVVVLDSKAVPALTEIGPVDEVNTVGNEHRHGDKSAKMDKKKDSQGLADVAPSETVETMPILAALQSATHELQIASTIGDGLSSAKKEKKEKKEKREKKEKLFREDGQRAELSLEATHPPSSTIPSASILSIEELARRKAEEVRSQATGKGPVPVPVSSAAAMARLAALRQGKS